MIRCKKLIVSIVCVWLIAPVVYGDMNPPAQLRCKHECPPQNLRSDETLLLNGSSGRSIFSGVIGSVFGSVDLIPESNLLEVAPTSNARHLQISASGSGSCYLCLYTLISLGLCSSVNRVKKISFGFIPEWYHDGGPSQIGHSYAVMPESLRSVPIWCFIQPEFAGESLLSRYFKGISVSLFRDSQFISDMLSSRGPPNPANRISMT